MSLNLPDPDRKPGDPHHAGDTNEIINAIRALEQRSVIPGPEGPQGPPGPASTVPGPPGPKGDQGNIGPEGPRGARGEAGPQGPIGPQGDPGTKGDQGPAGAVGSQGPKGDPGAGVLVKGNVPTAADLPSTGNTPNDAYVSDDDGHMHVWNGSSWTDVGQFSGPAGPQGPAGPRGADGPQGPAGATGVKGDTGAQGPKGDPGAPGSPGADGAAGPAGPKGDTGATGPQGPKGDPQTGAMVYKGDYMPNAYIVGDTVRYQNELWSCVQDVAAGASAPVAPYWEVIAGSGGGTVPDGTMVFKGAYMPLGYAANDVVTSSGDLFIARRTIPPGAAAPVAGADWALLAGAAPALALDDLTDVDTTGATDGQALVKSASGWVPGTVTAPPPDLTPYARKDGADFTGNVTAPGHAPDAGASVRNVFFLTATPDDTLGADGDLAVVVS